MPSRWQAPANEQLQASARRLIDGWGSRKPLAPLLPAWVTADPTMILGRFPFALPDDRVVIRRSEAGGTSGVASRVNRGRSVGLSWIERNGIRRLPPLCRVQPHFQTAAGPPRPYGAAAAEGTPPATRAAVPQW
jgi:hypothetical protein